MEDKGKIISTCDIDENLALQIWTRGKTPRLSIFNKAKNSRKLIQIAWVEKRDRTLTINGRRRGQTETYTVRDFEPAIQKILTEYAARTNFKLKYFKLVVDLEKAINRPEIVTRESDFALMTEEKRASLWIADSTGDDKGMGIFLPFFPMNDAETAAAPDDKLEFNDIKMRGYEGLAKTGVPAELKKANPERWQNVIRVTAAAMLLGFSYCGAEGTAMAESIWSEGEKKAPTQLGQVAMKTPVKKLSIHDSGLLRLGHKLTAFIRHFYYIDEVKISYVDDSTKFLQDEGYERSRRVDFNTGTLGDVPYRVTFHENPNTGMTAFGCAPRMQTARHKGDMLIVIPTETYKQALKNDTMGNPDDFYTITRLLWAKQFKAWYENLKPYVKGFAGLV
ncbi:MAG: hypothetical protein IJS28_08505 [Synergistaceae bacterium]|nr:hypothetical protein [Synergistaceae bacterium]